jgi:hypothetical protein
MRLTGTQGPSVKVGPGPSAPAGSELILTAWMDWVTSPSMEVNLGFYKLVPGYGLTVAAVAIEDGYTCNACVTQVGQNAGGDIGFWGNSPNMPGWAQDTEAVVTAYTLDGEHSIEMLAESVSGPDSNASYQVTGWTVRSVTGSAFSTDGTSLIVAAPCLMACNYLLLAEGSD